MSQAPGFMRGEGGVVEEVLGLGRQGQGEDDEVGVGQQLGQRVGWQDARSRLVDARQRLPIVAKAGPEALPRPPTRGDHPAAEARGQRRHRPADRAEADDPDRDVAHLARLERLPGPLALELEQLGQVPRDGQDHDHHVLGDRLG